MPLADWLESVIEDVRRATLKQPHSPRRTVRSKRASLEFLEDRLAPADLVSASMPQAYGQLPISFEANVGQSASQVQYLARGSGYALFLTADSAVLSLTRSTTASAGGGSTMASAAGVALAMRLVEANPHAQVTGQDPLSGTSNYFVGNDPSQWHANIANYSQVSYQDVYPGVNLVYYGNQQQLEYDFDVAPGADPRSIRFAVQGADSLSLDAQGNLVLHSSSGDVVENAPVLYQTVNGVQQPVAGQFVLLGQDQVGFQVGAYDHSQTLTIDPVVDYSTFFGGSESASASSIAVGKSGNAYITGYTTSADFPSASGSFQRSLSGSSDVFVTELNATGTSLLYSTYLGGNNDESANSIAIDSSGNAYIVGVTLSSNFPTTAGALQTSNTALSDGSEAFVTKLNPSGTALSYSTYLGGNAANAANGVVIDSSGDAYVVGSTSSTQFPTTPGVYQTAKRGIANAFVVKLNPTGSALVFGTYLGIFGDSGHAIALDSSRNIYVTGSTQSTNFPTTSGALQTVNGGSLTHGTVQDAFVVKLNSNASGLLYSTYFGGNGLDEGDGIAVDALGDAYIVGGTASPNLRTTTGAFQTVAPAGENAFVAKLNQNGTGLIYGTYLGGSGDDHGSAIAIDSFGNAYVSGYTGSSDFPIAGGPFQPSSAGGFNDAYFAKLNAAGSALLYGTYLGGTLDDDGNAIALDGSGSAYVVGDTGSADFPTTVGAFRTGPSGQLGAFVTKFDFPPPAISSISPSSAVKGSAGFTLTINGSNFDPLAAVLWNSVPLTVTARIGSIEIHAAVPASLIAAIVPVSVTVDNSGPIATSPTTFKITPGSTTNVTLGIEFASGSVNFDGHPHGAAATWVSTGSDGGGGPLTVTYVGISPTIYGPSSMAPTNAGNYTASAMFVGDANHAGSSKTVNFTIAKADPNAKVAGYFISYGGQQHMGIGSARDVHNQPLPASDFNLTGTVHTNAGTYASDPWTFDDPSGNYAAVSGTVADRISRVGSTTSVMWIDGTSTTYSASPHAAIATWTSTGADGEHGPLLVTYAGILGTAYGPTTVAPINSGNYQALASFAGDVNHTGSSSFADFTINRVSPTSTETFDIDSVALQPSIDLALDNDFTRFVNAFADIRAGDTVVIHGTLDWSEPNALASWKATGEAYALPHVDGITVDAASLGDGVHGPGDDPSLSGEGPFYFDGLGTDKGWNITGLTISNFDTAFFYAPEADVTSYADTHLTNNTIIVPNANSGAQNGGILLGPSPNQTVQGNTIDITGNGGATAASFGISSFAYDGNGAWNNLLLDNNTINVTTAGANQKIIGIAENSGSIGSNITVTNNTFNGDSGSLAGNQQVAFGITSQATSMSAVVYTGNKVNGAKDGFVWGDPEASPAYNFAGGNHVPIAFSNTTLSNVGTGFVARDGGTATINGTTITNNGMFNFGTAFAADGAGTVITVFDPIANFTGVSALKNETNGGLVIFLNNAAGIQNVSKAEGNSGYTLFSFPVTLSAPLAANQMLTVDYATSSGTADGNDYNTANGTLTIQPGQQSGTIAVKVLGDLTPEPNENFFVNLSNPILYTNGAPKAATLASTQAVGTILNDDSPTASSPVVSITSISLPEGTPAPGNPASNSTIFTFTISYTGTLTTNIKVNWATANGSALGGQDYQQNSGQVTLTPTATSQTFSVTVFADKTKEPDENFFVNLTNPGLNGSSDYTLGTATGIGTIVNDD
jgi:hypothetical protein